MRWLVRVGRLARFALGLKLEASILGFPLYNFNVRGPFRGNIFVADVTQACLLHPDLARRDGCHSFKTVLAPRFKDSERYRI